MRFVVDAGVPYRTNVRKTDRVTVLETEQVSTETLFAETDITSAHTDDLSPSVREVVVAAIESDDGFSRFDRDAVDMAEFEELTSALIRHDGGYYVLYRSHSDDFSLVPLIRVGLAGIGGIIGFASLYVWYRARNSN